VRTQVEPLDLDLAIDCPERMTPRLQPLDEPAVDIEQTRLVALDHCISNVWITLAR
jgi:hypothetical protein